MRFPGQTVKMSIKLKRNPRRIHKLKGNTSRNRTPQPVSSFYCLVHCDHTRAQHVASLQKGERRKAIAEGARGWLAIKRPPADLLIRPVKTKERAVESRPPICSTRAHKCLVNKASFAPAVEPPCARTRAKKFDPLLRGLRFSGGLDRRRRARRDKRQRQRTVDCRGGLTPRHETSGN